MMAWTTEITIKNNTSLKYSCKIKKGQVFENKRVGTGFQNVAAAKDYVLDLQPNTTGVFQIEVLCINQNLKSPHGNLNLTNYMVSTNFQSQHDLWQSMNIK